MDRGFNLFYAILARERGHLCPPNLPLRLDKAPVLRVSTNAGETVATMSGYASCSNIQEKGTAFSNL